MAQSYVAEGMRLVDRGDHMAALPWLAEALDLDRGDPNREPAHRFRLSDVLRRCPRLTKLVSIQYASLTPAHYNQHLGGDIYVTDLWSFDRDTHRLVVAEINEPSATGDRTFQGWDIESGAKLFEPMVVRNALGAIANAKNLSVLACTETGGRPIGLAALDIWDLKSKKNIWRKPMAGDRFRWARLNGTGTQVLLYGADTVQVWDVSTRTEIFSLTNFNNALEYAVFLHRDQRLVTATTNGIVQVWNALTGEPVSPRITQISAAPDRSTVEMSPDGRRLLLTDGSIAQLWDIGTGQRVGPPMQHRGSVSRPIQFSPNGNFLLTYSEPGGVHTWNAHTGQLMGASGVSFRGSEAAEFSPDSRRIVIGGRTLKHSAAQVWNLTLDQPLSSALIAPGWLLDLHFNATGNQVAMVTVEKRDQLARTRGLVNYRVWELAHDPPHLHRLDADSPAVNFAISPDSRRIATLHTNGTARIWNLADGTAVTLIFGDRIEVAAFSSDGTRLATGGSDDTARVWDSSTGHPMSPPLAHSNAVVSVHFSTDGRSLLTGSSDGVVHLWEIESGQPLIPPQSEPGLRHAFISSDGRRIITAGNAVTVRDASTGQPVRHGQAAKISRHTKGISAGLHEWFRTGEVPGGYRHPSLEIRHGTADISFTADGERFVATDATRACIRDSISGVLLTSAMPDHANELTRAIFSPDGARIATASRDHTARVWDATTGEPVGPPIRHDGIVVDVAFSPDGHCVVTASHDKTVRIWDAGTAQPAGPILRHPQAVQRAAFTPDGRYIVTLTTAASPNSQPAGAEVHIWEVPQSQFSAEDLVLLARLTSGTSVEKNHAPVQLPWNDLQQFKRLEAKYPEYFHTFATRE